MSVHLRNALFVICIFTLVSLACVYLLPDEKLYFPNPEAEVSGETLQQWEATATASAAATRAPRLIVAEDQS